MSCVRITVAAAGLLLLTAPALSSTIDFETPVVSGSQVISPYVDAATGVVFTSPGANVGLVQNLVTSSCVPPADTNQKLGTGPLGSTSIGLSNFEIHATFMGTLPVTMVSVEFQALAGTPLLLALKDASGAIILQTVVIAGPGTGSCYGGAVRARTTLNLTSPQPAASAVMAVGTNSVFVIDNFMLETPPVPAQSATWGGVKALFGLEQ